MSHTDRNLLFGILAVQMNFVGRDALIAAMHAWVLERSKPLGQILVEQQALSPSRQSLLEQLVDEHLAAHDGDAEKSLAAVGGIGPIRDDLGPIADFELHATLNRIVARCEPTERVPDATLTYDEISAPAASSRFRILRPHAKGGLGQISVALDSELNREVALKELRPERADDPSSRARFLLEAEVTGRLEHPGVVPVYGLGCDAEGRPFYVMRFVKGDSLKEAIERFHQAETSDGSDPRRWNLELRQLLNRFVAVCNVVAYAHSRGVIHRDLKPANILLGPYGETLVVDWGLAKVVGRGEAATYAGAVEATLQPASGSGSSETLPGTALGTPAYMSPEQAEGRLEQVGPLSDLYSLGATLYCLLTGKPPLEGEVGEVLRRAQRGEFLPSRKANQRVPPALEAVCSKAMATKPEARYSSPRALAEDLEHWLADESVAAYRDPMAVRLTRWGRRHRTAAVGIGALLVTAIIGLAISTFLIGREQARTREKADDLTRQDYIHRINRAYHEAMDNNVHSAEQLLDACPPALRGWEWSFIHRLCHLDLRTFEQPRQVHALAFSPDGRLVASGGGDWPSIAAPGGGVLIVRDAETGRELSAHHDLENVIAGVAFSPDGRRLASAGYRWNKGNPEADLAVWDATTGQVISRKSDAGTNVLCVAFSPDGKHLAAGYTGTAESKPPSNLRLCDPETGEERSRIPGPRGGVRAVAFSPDSRRVALTGLYSAEVWELDSGGPRRLHTLGKFTSFVYAVAFSPDGKQIATGGWDKVVTLWDAEAGREIRSMTGHAGFVYGLAFSPDGLTLASASEDRAVKLWDVESGREVGTLRGHESFAMGVAFHPMGKRLASCSIDGTVKLWDARTSHPIVLEHGAWVGGLAFRRDGARLAASPAIIMHDSTIKVWDPTTGERIDRPHAGPGPSRLVIFSPDGRTLISAGIDEQMRIEDADTGREMASFPIPGGDLESSGSFRFSPDQRQAAMGGRDGMVRLLDLSDGRVLRSWRAHTSPISAVAYTPDGGRLATASVLLDQATGESRPGGEVKVWDTVTGREVRILRRGVGIFRVMDFSPDGRRLALTEGLATFARSGEVSVWDAETGREVFTLRGHATNVDALAFCPDGSRLATGSLDRTIKLWDMRTGDEVLTLRGHTAGVVSLAFSPDGLRLVSGGIDWTARIWDGLPLELEATSSNPPQDR